MYVRRCNSYHAARTNEEGYLYEFMTKWHVMCHDNSDMCQDMSAYHDADTPQPVFLRLFLMHLIKKLETEFTEQVNFCRCNT